MFDYFYLRYQYQFLKDFEIRRIDVYISNVENLSFRSLNFYLFICIIFFYLFVLFHNQDGIESVTVRFFLNRH